MFIVYTITYYFEKIKNQIVYGYILFIQIIVTTK